MSARRRPRSGRESQPHSDRWMISYADFLTLMFAVFVTLYSISAVAPDRAEQLVRAIEDSFDTLPQGAEPGASEANADFQREAALRERAFAFARELGSEGGVQVRESRAGLVLTLTDALFFRAGSQTLSPEAAETVRGLASLLAELPNHIRVEGHTDARGSSSANWQLSSIRAAHVVAQLERAGVPGHRLSAAGFGSTRPLASNGSREGRALNRRVDIVVVRSSF